MRSTLDRMFWLCAVPAVIGFITGACVAGLLALTDFVILKNLAALPGIAPALFAPLGLVLTYVISRVVTGTLTPSTSELYIVTYHQPRGRIPLRQVPGRILATLATVGLGGSQGFESTSALVGAAWSELAARLGFGRLGEQTRRALQAAGASGGIAAVFSSPATGALYGIEIPFKTMVDAPKIVPCTIAATSAYFMRTWLIGSHRIVDPIGQPAIDVRFLCGCLLTALLAGAGAWSFAMIEAWFHEAAKSHDRRRSLFGLSGRIQRAIFAGALLSALAVLGWWVTGDWITFSSGYIATGWLEREPRPLTFVLIAFVIRASGNLVTVYGGGGGGVFTSLAANGAFIGQAVAIVLGCDSTYTLSLIGAACFLGAGYRLPFACMLFVAEAGIGIAPTCLGLSCIAIAYALMGNKSVSEAQVDEPC